ncbi:MAG TPA: helix-turn-helix transcriptional regulator [Bacilli bacterium]|nr:helix-turn-helix transcriptional regulator [Bacilli bacterium]
MHQSQLTSTTDTINLDLVRRITEIMDERQLSIRGFSQYCGMSKDLLFRIVKGQRYIKPTELERMAQQLKVTVERLKMEDIQDDLTQLTSWLKEKAFLRQAVELASKLKGQALGYTERYELLNQLGTAHYHLAQFDQAHEAWEEAFTYAEKSYQLFADPQLLYKSTFNLILSYNVRKDFSMLAQFLERIEPEFMEQDPEYAGSVSFSYALMALEIGNLEVGRQKMYRSAEFYRMTGNRRYEDMAANNLAFVEYVVGNFHKAEEMYEQLMECPSAFDDLRYYARKGYAQTLLKVKRVTKAKLLIEESIGELEENELPNILARFYLLQAFVQNDRVFAEKVLAMENLEPQLYLLASKFLLEQCEAEQDMEGMIKYLRLVRQYDQAKTFEQEVFQI